MTNKSPMLFPIATLCLGAALGVFLYARFFAGSDVPDAKLSSQPAGNQTAQTFSSTSHTKGNARLEKRLNELETTLTDMQLALRAEQQSTLALQQELQDLAQSIADEAERPPLSLPQPSAAASLQRQEPSESNVVSGAGRGMSASASASASQELALISAGVDSDTARLLRERLDRYQLAELEVRDTAAREGWLDSEDYAARRRALLPERVNIRSEIGEPTWDSYLLALGRNNRVQIASILSGSVAAAAGFEVGDLLLEYADKRIFTVRELQQATRAGNRGELVSVRLGRGEGIIDTTVERGPLGVTLAGVSRPADPPAAQ